MKYQSTKHKELWDRIIDYLEAKDFSMGFKPFDTLYTDYCIAVGLKYASYACEYAESKAPYSYYLHRRKTPSFSYGDIRHVR